MKLDLIASKEILQTAGKLAGEFGFELGEGVKTEITLGAEELKITYRGGKYFVAANRLVQVFYALKRISDFPLPEEDTEVVLPTAFRELCYMLDCSRNAVPEVETVKSLVRHLAVMGYDSLGLYMEDTFVVENQPYFGYLRTPFTKEDIREIDDYCHLFGIELVPYIQTLAHFNSLIRHYAMGHLFDCNDILLVGEESTYRFIEDLIKTCAEYFTSRRINIGMDEAYMLGRGKYMDLHGARSRFDIMGEHLARVIDLCKKYGFRPAMWSDMFFSLAMNAQYGDALPADVVEKVPKDVELIYWDYCSTDEEHYFAMMQKHRVFPNEIGFAGGAWKWLGYTPDNRYSFASLRAAARACKRSGIRDFIVTGWGDNGADCSPFATLPSLLYASALNYGEEDPAFERSFLSLAGMSLKSFLNIDLCNRVTDHDDVEEKNSANKYLLFNDILLGTLDTTLGENTSDLYAAHTKALQSAKRGAGKWEYLFETQYRLSRVLEIKSDLGVLLRRAYQSGDTEALAKEFEKLKKLPARVEAFYRALRCQWERENRPFGFDVQDIRIGALQARIKTAIEKIGSYLSGRTPSVPELEVKLLDFMGHGDEYEQDFDQCEWRWRRMSSVNVNE